VVALPIHIIPQGSKYIIIIHLGDKHGRKADLAVARVMRGICSIANTSPALVIVVVSTWTDSLATPRRVQFKDQIREIG